MHQHVVYHTSQPTFSKSSCDLTLNVFCLVLAISWETVSKTAFLNNLSLKWSTPLVTTFRLELENEVFLLGF